MRPIKEPAADVRKQVLEAAERVHEEIETGTRNRQTAEPFGAETAMPGNYFMQENLTDPLRTGARENPEAFGEILAEVTWDLLERCDDVDHTDLTDRMVCGAHRFVWFRWGLGAWGEGRTVVSEGLTLHPNPDKWTQENTPYDNAETADRQMAIDLIGADGRTHQVKVADKAHKPVPSDKGSSDVLWWVHKESGKVEKVA